MWQNSGATPLASLGPAGVEMEAKDVGETPLGPGKRFIFAFGLDDRVQRAGRLHLEGAGGPVAISCGRETVEVLQAQQGGKHVCRTTRKASFGDRSRITCGYGAPAE